MTDAPADRGMAHQTSAALFIRIATVVLTLVGAAVPASTRAGLFGETVPYGARTNCFKHHSKAWCALNAADLSEKIDDTSRERVEEAMRNSGASVADLAMIAGTAGGLFRPTLGFTRWGDVGMLLLGVLLEKRPPILGNNLFFGWMPYEMARTPEEATDVLFELTFRMTREALKDYEFEDATLAFNPHAPRKLIYEDDRGWLLRGKDCEPEQCWLWNRRIGYGNPEPPKEGKAPEWLGGYKAWVFDRKSSIAMYELWTGAAYETFRYAGAVSRLLPDWLFIALTPEYKVGVSFSHEGVTLNPRLKTPLLFNAGKPLLLVFPELEVGAGQTGEDGK